MSNEKTWQARKDGTIVLGYDNNVTTERMYEILEKALSTNNWEFNFRGNSDIAKKLPKLYEIINGGEQKVLYIHVHKLTNPGKGAAGFHDKKRIQISDASYDKKYGFDMNLKENEKILLLGVYERDGLPIIVAWDYKTKINHGKSASSHIHVKNIAKAMRDGFSQDFDKKGNICCAFRLEFLPFYIMNMESLHKKDLSLVNTEEKQIVSHSDKLDFSKDYNLSFNSVYLENEYLISQMIKSALQAGKHIIFTGPPGTGKSKMSKELCDILGVSSRMTTAEVEWSTYDTIGSYIPNEDNKLIFKEGIFLQSLKKNEWLIIDEINRADIDKAFGSMFSVLAGDTVELNYKALNDEYIKISPSDTIVGDENIYSLPNDWRMIGTMNSYDKSSLFDMSFAFMRRFAFIPISIPKVINEKLIENYFVIWKIENSSISDTISKLWNIINKYRKVGPAIIKDIAETISYSSDIKIAIVLYIFPQFEALSRNDIDDFLREVSQEFDVGEVELKTMADEFYGLD